MAQLLCRRFVLRPTCGLLLPFQNNMASQQDQRASDFHELQQTLAQQPRISITRFEGAPPDRYEIEYNLTGLVKNADGSVGKAAKHLILITLPFGYPHFPPAVKPLTPIFHPDMDPDAVRISAYWQNSPSLAKLVLHLGDMICGKEYELAEPFNQEAAEWYAAHAADLPCDTVAGAGGADELDLGLDLGLADLDEPAHAQEIDLSSALAPALEIEDMTDLEPVETDSGAELSFELESPQPVHDLAGLTGQEEEQDVQEHAGGEDDFGLELDLAPAPEPAAEPPPQDIGPRLEEIRIHVRKKEMEIAARLLAGLPAHPDVEDLRLRVRTALEERDELLAELKAFEDEDNFDEAKRVFKKIKTVAVDTPDLAEIAHRLEQSQNMLAAFAQPPQKKKAEAVAEPAAEEASGPSLKKKEKKIAKEPPPPPRKEKQAVREEKKEISTVKRHIVRTVYREVPVMPFAIAAGVAAVVVVVGLIYTRDANNLLEAQLAWQEAQQLFRQRECQQAEAKANAALSILNSVLTPLPTKGSLKKEIADLQASEDYQLCKDGKGKYKDKTLPLPEVKVRQELDKLEAAAKHALEKGDISTATEMYKKAYKLAVENGLTDEAVDFKKRADELFLKDALQRVTEAQQVKDWENVVTYSRQGIDAARELGDSETQEKLNKILAEALFSRDLYRFKKQFGDAHGQWQQCLDQLKTLQVLLQENPTAVTSEKKLEMEQLMARCQLYQLLSLANEAYINKGDSTAAVSYYEQALALLDEKRHLFTAAEQATAAQISSTILRIRISDLWSKAAEAEKDGRLSPGLEYYREIKNMLRRLDLKSKDEDLVLFEKEVDSRISRLQQVVKGQQSNEWLQKNYKRLFLDAFPHIDSEQLNSPSLEFIRMINGKELYKIRCREGRMYSFELRYLHDPATSQWTRYFGPANN